MLNACAYERGTAYWFEGRPFGHHHLLYAWCLERLVAYVGHRLRQCQLLYVGEIKHLHLYLRKLWRLFKGYVFKALAPLECPFTNVADGFRYFNLFYLCAGKRLSRDCRGSFGYYIGGIIASHGVYNECLAVSRVKHTVNVLIGLVTLGNIVVCQLWTGSNGSLRNVRHVARYGYRCEVHTGVEGCVLKCFNPVEVHCRETGAGECVWLHRLYAVGHRVACSRLAGRIG